MDCFINIQKKDIIYNTMAYYNTFENLSKVSKLKYTFSQIFHSIWQGLEKMVYT